MIQNMSIRSKLALGFLIIAVLPMIALGFVLFQDIKSEMLSSTEQDLMSIMNSLEREMNTFTTHIMDNINFISSMPNMKIIAEKMFHGVHQARAELRDIFDKAISSNKEIEEIFLLHPESGEVLASSDPFHEGMFLNKRPYFTPGKKGPVLYPVHYSLALEKNILAFAAPVFRNDNLLGVLVCWISTDALYAITRTTPPLKSSLVTRSNIHIIEPVTGTGETPFVSGVFSTAASRALDGITGSGIYADADGVDVVGAYTLLERLDTALLVEIPLADIHESVNLIGIRFLIITLGVALVVVIIAFIIGNQITNPIMHLARAIRKFGENGSGDRIDILRGGTEVTELATAFNTIMARQKAAEAALKRSESKLSEAQHIAHIGNWEYDVLKDRLWWSGELYTIFGLDPRNVSLSIHSLLNSVHPDDRSTLEHEMKSWKTYRTDYRIVRPGGEIRFIHEEVRISKDSEGNPLVIWGTAQDITELKQVENALRESEEKFREIVENSPVGISYYDIDSTIITCNAKLAEILGTAKDKIEGVNMLNTFRNDRQKSALRKALSGTTGCFEGEYTSVTSDKTVIIKTTYSPIVSFNGSVSGGISMTEDITERKLAEKLLMESEGRYRMIFENAPLGILHFDCKGIPLNCNDQFARIIGAPKEKVLSIHMLQELRDDQMKAAVVDCLSGKTGHYEGNYHSVTGDKLTAIKADFSPLISEQGTVDGGIGMFEDISERKQAEEKTERLNIDLAQKNKELEQILYVTSHDLRSPLVNIEGFGKELELSLQVLVEILHQIGISHDAQAKIESIIQQDIPESMQYIRSSTKKMDLLLTGLLRLSRLGRTVMHKVPLDMNRLISDIVRNFEFQLKRSEVKIEILKLPRCIGDAMHIDRVFSNLIDNAIKYLDHGRPGIIRIFGRSEGKNSVYCVADNGTGIAPDYREKIFEMFQRLDPDKFAGEGLGLTIAHRIIEMHKGRIWVESEPGVGSRFFVSLPA